MTAWDFLVSRSDLSRTEVRPAAEPDPSQLRDGEVLLAVERFCLTANNITYGVVGDQLGYWRFFPAPEGWGRIPVWGFARVIASRAEGVEDGLRLFGYWPMSTHLVARLRPSGSSFVDQAEHRAALAPAYNRYEPASETSKDDHVALLRPLFVTSFLLDDYLAEAAAGATPLLSSASSRTAIGLAWSLRRRGQQAVGLTSRRNKAFVEGLSLYEKVVLYEDLDHLAAHGSVAYVDMAGDADLRGRVHARLGEQLVLSAVVGATHHEARAQPLTRLPGPVPSFFFAPDRLRARRKNWGADVLESKVGHALSAFVDDSSWLEIRQHQGQKALGAVYQAVFSGEAKPADGHIILPMI